MSLKKYFTGKTGVIFWINIIVMIALIVAVPFITLQIMNSFTRHGEKIEVPSVEGCTASEAERILMERGLKGVVTDSVYKKSAKPGAVLEQMPKPGFEVKPGRMIYLTVNYLGEPMAALPDVVKHGSIREAESMLKSLGFKVGPCERIYGEDKDLVVAMKVGGRRVKAGEKVSKNKMITLVVGAGTLEDTLDVDDSYMMDDDLIGDYGAADDGDSDGFDLDL